jgi:amino acid transporter
LELTQILFGRPLRTSQSRQEEISPVEGLSALSLDALTSVAYGPQALLVALGAGGLAALRVAPWITLAIVGLLVLLVSSYIQVIGAYPSGGGAYAVARANLGTPLTLLAGASLVVDYILTVAVSIAAGVGSLVSAFTGLAPYTEVICLAILALITMLNMRGLGESARAFLLPTMAFIFGILVMIVIGLVHPLDPNLHQPGSVQVATHALEAVGILLVLKAFSAGCSALTGVEAIANGVPLFRQPRQERARTTEIMLGVLLAVMLLGLAVLVQRFHVDPRTNDAVLNQIIAYTIGRGWGFDALSIIVTIVLALAANTSFGSLPVLASRLAEDNRLPHAFAVRGDRLVFNYGIWALAGLAAVMLLVTGGNTDSLIPLFAIGVFTGFTLAQSGMVHHWWKERSPGWRRRATLNGAGAITTGMATVIFIFTKFLEGAWIVVVAIPLLILLFMRVHGYYNVVAREIGLDKKPGKPKSCEVTVVVPVINVSRLTQQVLGEALSLGDHVIAATVVFEDEEEQGSKIQEDWKQWDPGVELVVLRSEYHSAVKPLVQYINSLKPGPAHKVVVLIPVVLPRKWWHSVLHNHLDHSLTAALKHRHDVVVAKMPLLLKRD